MGPTEAEIEALYTDNCGNINATKTGGPTGTDCSWTVTYNYTIEDDCGNFADEVNITYSGGDTEAPTLVGTIPSGGTDLNLCFSDIPAGPTETEIAALFTDNCGNVNVVKTGEPEGTDCSWTVTYHYEIDDDCDNYATPIDITYSGGDTEDPEIINLPVVADLCNDAFPSELFADWTDNCAAGGTGISSGAPEVKDFECYQEALYTFYVEDDCGNSDTETVTVTRYYDQYDNCNTAYGLLEGSETCFSDGGFLQWGWTNYIVTEGIYTMDLWAGAAHCDTNNGALVGTVTVTYEAGMVDVLYQLTSGYVMSQGHVYIGCEPYPEDDAGNPTVAPGQYNFNFGSLDYAYSYSLEDVEMNGPFYIIAHARTCEETCRCSTSADDGGTQYSDADPINCLPSVVEIDENQVEWSLDFRTHPVPFNNDLFVSYNFDYDTNVDIQIFDMKGLLVKHVSSEYTSGTNGVTKVDLAGTMNQVLFVKVMTKYGVGMKKVVSSNYIKKN